SDSPALPKPAQTGGHRGTIPVLVGGHGKRRTPELAARYADEFNAPFASLEATATQFGRVRAAMAAAGRDAASMTFSTALVACVGATEAEVERRAAAIGRDTAELRENGLAGTPEEVVEKIKRFAEAGASRIYLQILDPRDLEHLDLVAAEVMPHL
ncbi:MAG: LLM class flavin-dependent oxidoreductase, partial [Nocardioides sp.]